MTACRPSTLSHAVDETDWAGPDVDSGPSTLEPYPRVAESSGVRDSGRGYIRGRAQT